jgi:hypothetical protein
MLITVAMLEQILAAVVAEIMVVKAHQALAVQE